MRQVAFDDMPLLSQWIKNSRSEEREFSGSFELNGTNEICLKTEDFLYLLGRLLCAHEIEL